MIQPFVKWFPCASSILAGVYSVIANQATIYNQPKIIYGGRVYIIAVTGIYHYISNAILLGETSYG